MVPNIMVVPILKKEDETIVGTINNNENGFVIPPVKKSNKLNCIKSKIRNNDE